MPTANPQEEAVTSPPPSGDMSPGRHRGGHAAEARLQTGSHFSGDSRTVRVQALLQTAPRS